MIRKFLVTILMAGLMTPGALLAQEKQTKTPKINPPDPPASAQPARPAAQEQAPQTVRPQPASQRANQRSYERETRTRRHRGISKKEWLFLGAVAGTSMGIGAIAAGAHGLAIGAIVGGWSAFAAHKLWHFIR